MAWPVPVQSPEVSGALRKIMLKSCAREGTAYISSGYGSETPRERTKATPIRIFCPQGRRSRAHGTEHCGPLPYGAVR